MAPHFYQCYMLHHLKKHETSCSAPEARGYGQGETVKRGEQVEAALLALGAAAMGSLTTLVSVLLTQRSAERLRRHDQERADRHRTEDRRHARENQLLEERQASYAKLNAAARTARDALVLCTREFLDAGRVEPQTRTALDSAWTSYVTQHAEAHMSVSDEVLETLGSVNGSLRQMHHLVQALYMEAVDREAPMSELQQRSDELWDRLASLRDAMRTDLGITSRRRIQS